MSGAFLPVVPSGLGLMVVSFPRADAHGYNMPPLRGLWRETTCHTGTCATAQRLKSLGTLSSIALATGFLAVLRVVAPEPWASAQRLKSLVRAFRAFRG